LYSAAHGTFSKICYILRHKGSIFKTKKVEVTPCIPSYYNGINPKVKKKKKNILSHGNWKTHC
jgi:hypothetical protein